MPPKNSRKAKTAKSNSSNKQSTKITAGISIEEFDSKYHHPDYESTGYITTIPVNKVRHDDKKYVIRSIVETTIADRMY